MIATVMQDYTLGLETGWHTDHVHLQALSQNAVSALALFFSLHHDAPFIHFTQPQFLLYPPFPFTFALLSLVLTTTTADYIHIKLHPHYATTTIDKASSKHTANTHHQHMPLPPPDTTTDAAHTLP